MYVQRVCEDVFADPLNSAVQLAGLRLLTNMTVTNDYQHLLSSYIAGLLHLLLIGNGSTKVGVPWSVLQVESCYIKLSKTEFAVCVITHSFNLSTLGCRGRQSLESST